MHHPDVEVVDAAETEDDLSALAGIVPVYPSTEGLHQKLIRRIAGQALTLFGDKVPEALPPELVEQRALLPPGQALALCHLPPDESDIGELNAFATSAHRRLVYEELFWLELGLALKRRGLVEEPAAAVTGRGELLQKFRASLPFKFTAAQEKVLAEIGADMGRPYSMHRLLQGDVGSGKTVVALAAALLVIETGRQVAIMAPTELLAVPGPAGAGRHPHRHGAGPGARPRHQGDRGRLARSRDRDARADPGAGEVQGAGAGHY